MPYSDPAILRTYSSWHSMVNRCGNPRYAAYDKYGGSGIKVCKRWLAFKFFLKDIGIRPIGTVIDRKNNKRGYNPSNCRWATHKESTENRSNTVWINGMRVNDLAEKLDLTPNVIYLRLAQGWSVSDIIKYPRIKHGFDRDGNNTRSSAHARHNPKTPGSAQQLPQVHWP